MMRPAMLAFDHVIIAVTDLDAAAGRLWRELGVASVAGGRHPGHGTGNRIAPLGSAYLELMSVVDRDEAAQSTLGRFVTDFVSEGDRLMALCLRTDDIGTATRRLGLQVLSLTRTRPDGVELSMDLAGLDGALGPDRLPFFIEWHVPQHHHPGRTVVRHHSDVAGIAWVELGGDEQTLRARLGDHDLDLRVVPGAPGPHAVGLGGSGAEIRW